MIIFHANGKRLQLAHENEEFFIFQTESTFVKNAVSYFKEEKNVLWDPFNFMAVNPFNW